MEKELIAVLKEKFGKSMEEACMAEIYQALLFIVRDKMKVKRKQLNGGIIV